MILHIGMNNADEDVNDVWKTYTLCAMLFSCEALNAKSVFQSYRKSVKFEEMNVNFTMFTATKRVQHGK